MAECVLVPHPGNLLFPLHTPVIPLDPRGEHLPHNQYLLPCGLGIIKIP